MVEPKVKQLTPKETRHWAVRVGLGLLALGLAYIAASLAIDKGNSLYYFAMFALVIIGVREFLLSIRETWQRKRA